MPRPMILALFGTTALASAAAGASQLGAPLDNPSALDLYPAGGTPLWLSHRFAPDLGHGTVYIKDERYGPTSSFKDRQAAVAVAAMNENGVREAVIASTGNAAVAYAAACARLARADSHPWKAGVSTSAPTCRRWATGSRSPKISTSPASLRINPSMQPIAVVFPAPFGPRKP